jgi:hypothetical protein
MKARHAMTILPCALMTFLVAIQQCAAQTVSVHEVGVYYRPAAAGATRQPRSSLGGEFVVIPGLTYSYPTPINNGTNPPSVLVTTNPQTPYSFIPPGAAASLTVSLAYINILGGAGGGIALFAGPDGSYQSNLTVPVQDSDQIITVEYLYFPPGGGSCPTGTVCSTGAAIDEISETDGTLHGDYFVNVYSPPGSATPATGLTNIANTYGTVDTTNQSVRINASEPPTPYLGAPIAGGTFDKWVTGSGGTIGPNKHDLLVNEQTGDTALALYRSSCPAGYYSNSSTTVSQCSPIPPCPGAVWNPGTNTCVPVNQCEVELQNYEALHPSASTPKSLLSYYLKLLSACKGTQYTAAVAQIEALLKE